MTKDQDDRDKLIEEILKEHPSGTKIYADQWEYILTLAESHLNQKIRTATLDEVDESVESIDDYIHHNGFLFKRKLKERLDNLRGNDERP